MKVATVREFRNHRNHATRLMRERELVLVTRYGKVTSLLLPLRTRAAIPMGLRRETLTSKVYLSMSCPALADAIILPGGIRP